jgi:hypothetical protein
MVCQRTKMSTWHDDASSQFSALMPIAALQSSHMQNTQLICLEKLQT